MHGVFLWFGLTFALQKQLSVPPQDFDCSVRNLALEYAISLDVPGDLSNVVSALRLQECGSPIPLLAKYQRTSREVSPSTFYVAINGSDNNEGSLERPFATLRRARDASRAVKSILNNTIRASIFVRQGRYYLTDTLLLGPEDSGLVISNYQQEEVVLSGGVPLGLKFKVVNDLWIADTPPGFAFTTLILENRVDITREQRLTWAREPNGDCERNLQPDGYALVAGGPSLQWPSAEGALHLEVDQPSRNNSVYPIFGLDHDPREPDGWQWLHVGGTASRFSDKTCFWNGTVPLGLYYNETGGMYRGFNVSGFRTANWTREGYAHAQVNVFQTSFWGNWVLSLDSVNSSAREVLFDAEWPGGWQEGHGGRMSTQPFFVEGVREALDAVGEWWLDRVNSVLYIMPNASWSINNISLVAPNLTQLITIQGSASQPVQDVQLVGLTFTHTGPTSLLPYEVPSPGDWSIHRGGTLFAEGVERLVVDHCRFLRTGGNALFLSGYARNTSIAHCEMAFIADTAIATVGRLMLNDGYSVNTFPADTLITHNHIREVGVLGKQAAALFLALTCRTTFSYNVVYNGPRAGVNINDQFCHGHTLSHNLLFNFVRETQDHGPINTWNRAMYIWEGEDSQPTTVPSWAHIFSNFIMNGPSGNRDLGNMFPAIDNDDGSAYYHMSSNFLVYGGCKNYLGHDKIWVENVIAYPDRWVGDPCAQIWGGPNHVFENNTCVVGGNGSPLGLDGTILGAKCEIDFNDTEEMANVAHTSRNAYFTSDGSWNFQCGNGTDPDHIFTLGEMQQHGRCLNSTVNLQSKLPLSTLLALARHALGM